MKPKKLIRLLLQILFILMCAVFIYRYFQAHREEWRRALEIPLAVQAELILFLGINNILASIKLLRILKNLGLTRISYSAWLQIFLQSRFINFHVTQGANAYRIAKLKAAYQFPYTKSLGMTVYFTWFETTATLVIALFLLIFLGYVQNPVFLGLAAFLVGLLVGPFLFLQIFTALPQTTGFLQWARTKVQELITQITGQMRDPKLSAGIAFLTWWMFFFYCLTVFLTFHALKFSVTPLQAVTFTVVLLLSRVINVTPANLGLTEIVCGYLAGFLGSTMGAGILVAGILRVLEYILIGVCAVFFFLKDQRKSSSS